jgi:nucleoside-diphosphate-sugar epimerase
MPIVIDVQARRNDDITLYGDGSQTPSLWYVDNLGDRLIRLMDSRVGVVGSINLGSLQRSAPPRWGMTAEVLAKTLFEILERLRAHVAAPDS